MRIAIWVVVNKRMFNSQACHEKKTFNLQAFREKNVQFTQACHEEKMFNLHRLVVQKKCSIYKGRNITVDLLFNLLNIVLEACE